VTIVQDLLDEYNGIAQGMLHWHKYWRTVAAYVLPQTESFDQLMVGSPAAAISQVATMPVAAERSKAIYDMTSIWAIERLTAGLISLKTPETQNWHDLTPNDMFGEETSDDEKIALERVRNFLFAIRANPASGYWPAHKAAMRSMNAFGDGWMFIEEEFGSDVPWRYEFIPLPETYPACDNKGRPDTMYRPFGMTAIQIARKWGEKAGPKVIEMANDVNKRHNRLIVLHGVRPRSSDKVWRTPGARGGQFESHYILPEEKHHIGEGGYYEFPFIRYAWAQTGTKAQSEGPVAYALAEIRSLNEMSKNELIAQQALIRPPLGVYGRNFGRINFNPGAVNPNLMSAEGRPLFAPLTTGARPDFAQAIIEARRMNVREMLYLNLWQILVEQPEQTATEALIRAQEKGELLGPVGISLNTGLSQCVDREIGIMMRKGAFGPRSPLALPESLAGREVAPKFTSPLDRLRRTGEVVGMQRLAAFAGMLMETTQDPNVGKRLNTAEMLERARDILGAPVEALRPADEVEEEQQQQAQLQQLMMGIQGAQGAGDAMKSLGEGAAALTGQPAGGMGAAAQLPGIAQPPASPAGATS
jgi:hypothetical protein